MDDSPDDQVRAPDPRSERLARWAATRPPGHDSARRRRTRGVFVGWLVLMTVWGFGRAGWPDAASLFLYAGLSSGAVTAYVIGWRPSAGD